MIHNRSLPSLLLIVPSLFSHLGRHLLNSIYIVAHVFLYSLASSMHHLPSNLVPPLELLLVIVCTADFNCHAITLQEQQPLFDNYLM